jgi:H+/Cl- antiporter ClcA
MATTPARRLAKQLVPAIIAGVGSAVVLVVMDLIAEKWLHHLIWDKLPPAFGFTTDSRWWIFLVLTFAGVAVGLVVWLMPGHAGPDPATLGLIHTPSPLITVPSLLLAAIIGLACGVSLGPEFPILGANATLAVAFGPRYMPQAGKAAWAGLASAGTIGALFGTPVAAALMFTETFAGQKSDENLWDRLFAPLAAAAAGGLTATYLSGGSTSFSIPLPPFPGFRPVDLVVGALIAVAAATVGIAASLLFPRLYQLFHLLKHPMLILIVGGVCLGLLGAWGGQITLFKGLHQMQELADNYTAYSIGSLTTITVVKMLALLVAGVTGFRGGKIFPAVFIAAAFGFLINALFPSVPVSLAIACSALGIVLAVTRSGWLSIFLAAALVPDPTILVILAIAVLPAWLIVTARPEMIAQPAPAT